jgi:hypothetical protein
MISLYESYLDASPNVGTDEQIKNLLGQISQLKKSPSVSNTNDSCWRTESKYENIDWLLKEITLKVFNAVDFYSQKDDVFANAIQHIGKTQLKIFYWTNVNQQNSRNTIHSHTSAVFSGVYYIQGTETGALRMINPANILGNCNKISPFTRDFYYEPKDRDLILWPSWLPHEVEPNYSDRERINIAYDVVL